MEGPNDHYFNADYDADCSKFNATDFVLQTPLPSGAMRASRYFSILDNTTEYRLYGGIHTRLSPKTPCVGLQRTSLMFTGVSSDPGIVSVTYDLDAARDVLNDPTRRLHVDPAQPNGSYGGVSVNRSGQALMIGVMLVLMLIIAVPAIIFLNQHSTFHGVESLKYL